MKILVRGVMVIVLLLLVAGAYVYFNLGRLVKRAVETEGSKSLSLTTTLGAARPSLFGGTLELSDLRIGSPRGFSAPHMLELGGIGVAVRYRELRGNPIHVDSLTLKKPRLVI